MNHLATRLRRYSIGAPSTAIALTLSACGGGGGSGGGVGSTPSPPPSLAVSPIFESRQYEAISTGSDGESATPIDISVDGDTLTYTLSVDDPSVLVPLVDFHPEPNGERDIRFDTVRTVLADGTLVENHLHLFIDTDTLQNTALAEWTTIVAPASGPSTAEVQMLVFGVQTPTSELPVVGSATYSRGLVDVLCDCFGKAQLTADFATQQIGAQVDVFAFWFKPDHDAAVTLTGSGPIANAAFGFPVQGMADIHVVDGNSWTEAATGSLTGAFFGPSAREIGGVFSFAFPSNPERVIGGFALGR